MVDAAELHRTRGNIAKVKIAMADPDGVVEQYKMLLRDQEIPEYRAMAAKEVNPPPLPSPPHCLPKPPFWSLLPRT